MFDLGIGAPQVDLCVRIADMEIVAKLRAHVGQPLMHPGNPAMGIIFAYNPPRVFISRVGRCEVYQPIPAPGGTSLVMKSAGSCWRSSMHAPSGSRPTLSVPLRALMA